MLHVISASLLGIGLNFTSVASFQIKRGSAIVFVVLMSFIFLNHPVVREWIGILINPVIGDSLIVDLGDLDDGIYSDDNVIGDSFRWFMKNIL